MWVVIKKRGEKEDFQGQLNNDPTIAKEWTCGDLLEFMMDEIILLIPPE